MELSKKTQKQLKELWGKVGFIVNLSQMIEYTFANILSFDEILREYQERDSMFVFEHNEFVNRANDWYKKLEKGTLGFGINRAKEIKFFTQEFIEELTRLKAERDFVIHNLFKQDLFSKHLEINPKFYFERLETLINDMYFANQELNEIFKNQKAEYKTIW